MAIYKDIPVAANMAEHIVDSPLLRNEDRTCQAGWVE